MSNNAAAWLHSMVEGLTQQDQKKLTTGQAWSKVFGLKDADLSEVLRHLGQLVQQISVAEEQVLGIEDADHDLLLRPIRELARTFSHVHLGESLQHFVNRLPDHTLGQLALTAEFVRREYRGEGLTPEARERLLEQVEAFSKDIRELDVDPGVKATLLELVERLRRALLQYHLWGMDGVMEAIDLNLGYAARATAHQDAGSPTGKALVRHAERMVTFYNMVRAARGLKELAVEAIDKVLKLTSGG